MTKDNQTKLEQICGKELFALAREDILEVRRCERKRLYLLRQSTQKADMQYHAGSIYLSHGHKLIPYANVSFRLIRSLNDRGVI